MVAHGLESLKKHGPPNIGVFQKGQSTVFNWHFGDVVTFLRKKKQQIWRKDIEVDDDDDDDVFDFDFDHDSDSFFWEHK